jgi:hypothetical protein
MPEVKETNSNIKYMKDPARVLIERGLLHEINRVIMHPLGLALAVEWPETPEEEALAAKSENAGIRIWDNESDPEGVYYAGDADEARSVRFTQTLTNAAARLKIRQKILGYVVQGEPLEAVARRAYEAFLVGYDGLDHNGKPVAPWDSLPENVKQGWRESAKAIAGLAGLGA